MIIPFFYSQERRRLSQVAGLIGARVERDGEFENLGMFRNYGRQMLTLYYNERFRPQLEENIANFSCVLTTPAMAGSIPEHLGVLVSDDPLAAFLKLHLHFCASEPGFYTVDQPTRISPEAKVHKSAVIAERGVVIEAGTVVEPHAVIKESTYIGRNCVIGPGVAIGGPGFEMRYIDGVVTYVPHAGGVHIGDEVHVLANACIARAVFGGPTVIGTGCKIDHLVHVAHAAIVGRNCRLVAGSSIGGATQLGDDVWVGPNAVIANSLRVGDKAWIALGSAVVKDVPAGGKVGGNFARAMP